MSSLVLVTGFGSFQSIKQNPTEIIANELHGQEIDSVDIVSQVLPVTDQGVETIEALLRTEKSTPYAAIVHLGVDSSHNECALVEVCAWNYKASNHRQVLDGDILRGDRPPPVPIYPTSPHLLPTTANLQDARLNKLVQSSTKMWSRDAGTYYCNEVYYRTLWAIRQQELRNGRDQLIPCVFVHIPMITSADAIQHHVDYIKQVIKALL